MHAARRVVPAPKISTRTPNFKSTSRGAISPLPGVEFPPTPSENFGQLDFFQNMFYARNHLEETSNGAARTSTPVGVGL